MGAEGAGGAIDQKPDGVDQDAGAGLAGKRPVRLWMRLLLLIVVLGALTFLIYQTGLFRLFVKRQAALDFIHSLGAWGFAAFIFLQAVQVVVAPLPGEVTGFLGGYLYGPLLGVILSTVGLTLGSYVAFSLSRAFGRPLVERFVDKKSMERFDFLLHHKGAFIVFLIFLIPGFPKDIFTYILGLGHLTTLQFLAIATPGRLLGTILLTLGGSYLRHHQYGRFFTVAGLCVAVVFLSILFRDRLERAFREWQERKT